jgi:hypothetical protein
MKLNVAVLLLGSALPGLAAPSSANESIDQRLAERMRQVQETYQQARHAAIRQLDEELGIRYEALQQLYEEHERASREQRRPLAQASQTTPAPPPAAPNQAFLAHPEYLRYTEARLLLDNRLARNHLLRTGCLDAYESILDDLVDADPLLRAFFHSPDYVHRYGVLLKQVVWELSGADAASTKRLGVYTIFADRAQMPFLIQLSPAAFTSLPFLRSLLIHELNHVLLYKEPMFAELERPSSPQESIPTQPIPGWYSFFFNLRYGRTPAYQYQLVQEYYSFQAQLLYDDAAPLTVYHRLSPQERGQIASLLTWTFNQLSPRYQAFVRRYPDPPMAAYVRQSSSSRPPRFFG